MNQQSLSNQPTPLSHQKNQQSNDQQPLSNQMNQQSLSHQMNQQFNKPVYAHQKSTYPLSNNQLTQDFDNESIDDEIEDELNELENENIQLTNITATHFTSTILNIPFITIKQDDNITIHQINKNDHHVKNNDITIEEINSTEE